MKLGIVQYGSCSIRGDPKRVACREERDEENERIYNMFHEEEEEGQLQSVIRCRN